MVYTGSLGDYQNFNGGYAFHTNWSSSNTNYGPFRLNNSDPSNTNGSLGFRLASLTIMARVHARMKERRRVPHLLGIGVLPL